MFFKIFCVYTPYIGKSPHISGNTQCFIFLLSNGGRKNTSIPVITQGSREELADGARYAKYVQQTRVLFMASVEFPKALS